MIYLLLLIIFCLLIAVTSFWMRVRSLKARFETELKRRVDREMNLEAKALRAQMNPHFLFNSLNSIRLFVLRNDHEKAQDYISKFSRLLRMILNNSRRESIRVYDEIQSLKLYLEFERLRFDRDFDFNISISGQDVLDFQIPPMIIQPFVENAIWHGLMPRKDTAGEINVSFRLESAKLLIEVRDNGVGRQRKKPGRSLPVVKKGSVGLKITKDRLRSLSRKSGKLNDFELVDLFDEKGRSSGTLVKLYFQTNDNPL